MNIDLAPTIAELARATTPPFVDGRSLVPLLTDNPLALSAWRQAFLIEYWQPDSSEVYQALRTQHEKYVSYPNGEKEFYDLRQDPFELDNRYTQLNEPTKSYYESWLNALKHCYASACRELDRAAP
ncbi:MAG: DUF4976 domain-containing protein [Deinococcales bacterium]